MIKSGIKKTVLLENAQEVKTEQAVKNLVWAGNNCQCHQPLFYPSGGRQREWRSGAPQAMPMGLLGVLFFFCGYDTFRFCSGILQFPRHSPGQNAR